MFSEFIKTSINSMNSVMLSPEEIDKKLEELKTIETWMKMNLQMLQLSIQGLELQKNMSSSIEGFLSPQAKEDIPAKTNKNKTIDRGKAKGRKKTTGQNKAENSQTKTAINFSDWSEIAKKYNEIVSKSVENVKNNQSKVKVSK